MARLIIKWRFTTNPAITLKVISLRGENSIALL